MYTPSSCGSYCTTPDTYAIYDQSSSVTTGVQVTTVKETSTSTSAIISSGDSPGATDATYTFSVVTTNDIPTQGALVLTVPTGVTVPNSAKSFSVSCTSGCDNLGSKTISYSSSKLTITGAFSSYLSGGSDLKFDVTGWTNPSDTETYTFTLETFFDDGTSAMKGIEKFTGLDLGAADGSCYV